MPAVVMVDNALPVIQYTPSPDGTLSEKYDSISGRYFRICCCCCCCYRSVTVRSPASAKISPPNHHKVV